MQRIENKIIAVIAAPVNSNHLIPTADFDLENINSKRQFAIGVFYRYGIMVGFEFYLGLAVGLAVFFAAGIELSWRKRIKT